MKRFKRLFGKIGDRLFETRASMALLLIIPVEMTVGVCQYVWRKFK